MNKVKRSLDNQAIGLVPLLLFMFLDNYFSYLLSFIIGVTFCFVCIFLFQILSKDKVYQFLLLPAATTLVLYSIFLCLRLEPVLFIYSPLITEVLLVVVLAFLGFAKRTILRRIRTSQHPTYKRTLMRTTLNEFFFVAQLIQNLYTLHLFIILVYSILPETMQSVRMERFLYRELGIVIGVFLILYEQIRISSERNVVTCSERRWKGDRLHSSIRKSFVTKKVLSSCRTCGCYLSGNALSGKQREEVFCISGYDRLSVLQLCFVPS